MSSETPELKNWEEINRLLDSAFASKHSAGVGKALQNVTLGVVNTRHSISDLRISLEKVEATLKTLNEKLEESSKESANLSARAIKQNKWLVGATVAMATVSIIGLWNIHLANQIKNESVRGNQASEQPFLDFIGGVPVKFSNKGKGVALNVLLVRWDNAQKQLFITQERDTGGALAVDKEGYFNLNTMKSVTQGELIDLVSGGSTLLAYANNYNTNWLSLVYEDIYGNRFATLFRGSGGKYDQTIQLIRLN